MPMAEILGVTLKNKVIEHNSLHSGDEDFGLYHAL